MYFGLMLFLFWQLVVRLGRQWAQCMAWRCVESAEDVPLFGALVGWGQGKLCYFGTPDLVLFEGRGRATGCRTAAAQAGRPRNQVTIKSPDLRGRRKSSHRGTSGPKMPPLGSKMGHWRSQIETPALPNGTSALQKWTRGPPQNMSDTPKCI